MLASCLEFVANATTALVLAALFHFLKARNRVAASYSQCRFVVNKKIAANDTTHDFMRNRGRGRTASSHRTRFTLNALSDRSEWKLSKIQTQKMNAHSARWGLRVSPAPHVPSLPLTAQQIPGTLFHNRSANWNALDIILSTSSRVTRFLTCSALFISLYAQNAPAAALSASSGNDHLKTRWNFGNQKAANSAVGFWSTLNDGILM